MLPAIDAALNTQPTAVPLRSALRRSSTEGPAVAAPAEAAVSGPIPLKSVRMVTEHKRDSMRSRTKTARPGTRRHTRWLNQQLLVGHLRRCMYESGEELTDTDGEGPDGFKPKRVPSQFERLCGHAELLELFLKCREDALLGLKHRKREDKHSKERRVEEQIKRTFRHMHKTLDMGGGRELLQSLEDILAELVRSLPSSTSSADPHSPTSPQDASVGVTSTSSLPPAVTARLVEVPVGPEGSGRGITFAVRRVQEHELGVAEVAESRAARGGLVLWGLDALQRKLAHQLASLFMLHSESHEPVREVRPEPVAPSAKGRSNRAAALAAEWPPSGPAKVLVVRPLATHAPFVPPFSIAQYLLDAAAKQRSQQTPAALPPVATQSDGELFEVQEAHTHTHTHTSKKSPHRGRRGSAGDTQELKQAATHTPAHTHTHTEEFKCAHCGASVPYLQVLQQRAKQRSKHTHLPAGGHAHTNALLELELEAEAEGISPTGRAHEPLYCSAPCVTLHKRRFAAEAAEARGRL